MVLFPRQLKDQIESRIGTQKVLVIYGSRRTGKTYLMREIFNGFATGKKLWINGEDLDIQRRLAERTTKNYQLLFAGIDLLCIDEAQNIPNIGESLKFLIDEVMPITVIATGSSSFDLSKSTGAPLLGRSYTYHLMPISLGEISLVLSPLEILNQHAERMIYGNYPEIFQLSNEREKQEYLTELVQSSLLKDVFQFEGIQNSRKVQQLLQLIAYQMGSEVSYNELGNTLGLSKNTVERYLDLLEKNFILFSLRGFGNNERKEVTKKSKWYFYDNGIRNALIGRFEGKNSRTDWGNLFEAMVIQERQRLNQRNRAWVQYYFWRNYNQQEVDLIEKQGDQILAIECKLTEPKRVSKAFLSNYPEAVFDIITESNYLEKLK